MINSTSVSPATAIFFDFVPFFIIIIISTFLTNFYIIIIIITNKKLHIAASVFTGSACAASCILAMFSMPLHLKLLFNDFIWDLGFIACRIWFIFDFSSWTVNLLKLLIVTIIRLQTIRNPHREWAPKKVQILIFLLSWLFPFVTWSILLNVGLDSVIEDKCLFIYMDPIVEILAIVFLFILPLVILISVNLKLVVELKKRTKKVFNIDLKNPAAITNSLNQENSIRSNFY